MADFKDKVVFITGVASGFGKILSNKLSAAGAKLVIGDINQEGLIATVNSLSGDVAYQLCDVTKEGQVKNLVDLAVEKFGKLDIAINNAGGSTMPAALIDVTEADMDFNFALNAKSVLFGMKHQIGHMLESGGIILNVASMAGLGGAPKASPYAAAKHAVIGLTKTAAIEYGRKNIRVNAVCPYYTLTPLLDVFEDNTKAMVAKGSPMKRLGQPEEVVNTMISMIDPKSSYLNGQAIAVDGGVSAF